MCTCQLEGIGCLQLWDLDVTEYLRCMAVISVVVVNRSSRANYMYSIIDNTKIMSH